MNENRVPQGVSTGGQFAARIKPEPHLTLVPKTHAEVDPDIDEFDDTGIVPVEPPMGPDNPWAAHYTFPGYVPGEPPVDDPNGESAAVDCPACSGSGEVGTGRHEPDTGAAVTTGCSYCEGEGVVGLDGLADFAAWQEQNMGEPDFEQMHADRLER